MVLVACLVAAPAITVAGAQPAAGRLPPPASADFCMTVQQLMAGTSLRGENTVFTDMPSYRHSKPFVKPLRIYQVVTYAGRRPIVVSCKVKTAAQLRAVYGPQAAGTQRSCPDLTRLARDQAVAALRQAGNAAAAARAADGRTHLSSPGLFQDYDRWFTRFLPEKFQGQAYCHLPTVDYIEAVATGEMPPGATITTGEDAPVTPR